MHVYLGCCPLNYSILSSLGVIQEFKLPIFLYLIHVARDLAIIVDGPIK